MKTPAKLLLVSMVVAGSLVAGRLAIAHHSTVGQIATEITEITGTIKEFQFTNPHSWIQVDVTNDDGQVEEWSVEWLIPNMLMRRGYNPSTFPKGARVTMRLNQHVSGKPIGEFVGARLADGTVIGDWEDE